MFLSSNVLHLYLLFFSISLKLKSLLSASFDSYESSDASHDKMRIRGNREKCFHPSSGVIYITSFGSKWFQEVIADNETHHDNFEGSILEKFPQDNLIIYHEDDVPMIEGACMFDLRQISWLEYELQNKSSGLNKYYEIAGYVDPVWNPSIGDVKVGHALFMKVVAIYHAVHNSPEGSVVFWVDTDVTFREDLPKTVIEWIKEKDVVYIPFIIYHNFLDKGMPGNSFDLFDLTDPSVPKLLQKEDWWKIESGLYTFTVNTKTRLFSEMAVSMYRGGLLYLAKACFNNDPICAIHRIQSNVFTNDIFVYSLLLQSDANGDDFFHVGLNQGWFAMRGLEPWGTRNAVWGNHYYFPNFLPSNEANSPISNFHIGKYIFHHFGQHRRGAFATDSRQNQRLRIRQSWKTVSKPVNLSSSLLRVVEPYVGVHSFPLFIGKVSKRFTLCQNQIPEDSIADFALNMPQGLDIYQSIYDAVCSNLAHHNSISSRYHCKNRTPSPVTAMMEFKLNPFVTQIISFRSGYSAEFYAKCISTISVNAKPKYEIYLKDVRDQLSLHNQSDQLLDWTEERYQLEEGHTPSEDFYILGTSPPNMLSLGNGEFALLCDSQRVEDAIDDFISQQSGNYSEIMTTLCPLLAHLPKKYQCDYKPVNRIIGTIPINHTFVVNIRDGYSHYYYANCYCSLTSCTKLRYQQVISTVMSMIVDNNVEPEDPREERMLFHDALASHGIFVPMHLTDNQSSSSNSKVSDIVYMWCHLRTIPHSECLSKLNAISEVTRDRSSGSYYNLITYVTRFYHNSSILRIRLEGYDECSRQFGSNSRTCIKGRDDINNFLKYDLAKYDLIWFDDSYVSSNVSSFYHIIHLAISSLTSTGVVIFRGCTGNNGANEFQNGSYLSYAWRIAIGLRLIDGLDVVVGDIDDGICVVKVRKNSNPLPISWTLKLLPEPFNAVKREEFQSVKGSLLKLLNEFELRKWIERL